MNKISTRLEALAELHDRSPSDLLEWWLERAAIREYDGNIPRHRAEQLALHDVEDELEERHVPPEPANRHETHDTVSPVPQDHGSRTGQSDAPGEVER